MSTTVKYLDSIDTYKEITILHNFIRPLSSKSYSSVLVKYINIIFVNSIEPFKKSILLKWQLSMDLPTSTISYQMESDDVK